MVGSILFLALWIIIAYLVGALMTVILSISEGGILNRIFKRFFLGAVFSIVLFAIIRTGFETTLLLLPVLAIGIFITFYKSYFKFNFTNIHFAAREILFDCVILVLAGFVFWFLQLGYVYDIFTGKTIGLLDYQGSHNDFDYYVRLADYLQEFGIENRSVDFINPELYSVEPYHFFEVWAAAIPMYFSEMERVVAYLLVGLPFLMTILFFLVADTVRYAVKPQSTREILFCMLISLSYFFIGSLSFIYPNSGVLKTDLYSEDIFSLPKIIMVHIGLFLILKAILIKDIRWLLWVLVLAGAFYFPLMIVFGSIACILIFYNGIFSLVKSQRIFSIVYFLTGLVGIFSLLWMVGKTPFPELTRLQGESYSLIFSEFSFKTAVNVFGKAVIQTIFLSGFFVLFLLVGWKINKTSFKHSYLLYLTLFLLIPLAIYAAIHPLIDSVQFWAMIFVPVTNMIVLLAIVMAMVSKNGFMKYMGLGFIIFFLILNHPFHRCESCQIESETLSRLEKYLGPDKDPIFAYIRGGEEYEVVQDYGMHIYYPARELNRVVESYKAICISWDKIPEHPRKDFQLIKEQALWMNAFYRFCKERNQISMDDLQLDFLKKNGIRYLIVTPHGTIAPELRKHLIEPIRVFSDSSTLYKLKFN